MVTTRARRSSEIGALLALTVGACDGVSDRGRTDTGGIDAQTAALDAGADVGQAADGGPAMDAVLEDDAHAGSDAHTTLDAARPPTCETMRLPDFTATADEPALFYELPMEVDIEYRSYTVSYDVTVDDWPRECWNPAGAGGRGAFMGPFHGLAEIRKGRRFCRGGNLLETTVRAPSNGDLWLGSYWSETIGSSCSGEEHDALGSRPRHPLAPGTSVPFRVRYDAEVDGLDLSLGDLVRSGDADPAIALVARTGAPLYLVIGVERDIECYEPPAGDPDPQCCYATSVGWTYRNIVVELCR